VIATNGRGPTIVDGSSRRVGWPGLARIQRVVLPALAGGVLVTILAVYFQRGFIPGDSFTYLAAGERLNAGHSLYALVPGDRPVDLHPPFWTVPFLSPPPMGVVMRPFALLPGDVGAYAWWVVCLIAIGAVLAVLMRRRPATTSAAVIVLSIPIAYEIGVGNVNGLLLGAAIACWILVRDGRAAAAGPLAGLMFALKLTPLPVAGWVAGAGGRRGVGGVLAGLAVVGVVSLLGAGVDAHLTYLDVARTTATAGLSTFSPGGLARTLGLPDPIPTLVPTALLVGGSILAWFLARRSRPAAGFAVAIVAWTFGTAVVNINTPTLLLALLAPLAWPWRLARQETPAHPLESSQPSA
jgi:Glycosyltransferase family 87